MSNQTTHLKSKFSHNKCQIMLDQENNLTPANFFHLISLLCYIYLYVLRDTWLHRFLNILYLVFLKAIKSEIREMHIIILILFSVVFPPNLRIWCLRKEIGNSLQAHTLGIGLDGNIGNKEMLYKFYFQPILGHWPSRDIGRKWI